MTDRSGAAPKAGSAKSVKWVLAAVTLATVVAVVAWLLLDRASPARQLLRTPADTRHAASPNVPTDVTARTPRTVTATITVGGEPGGVAIDPGAHTVYTSVCTRCGYSTNPLLPSDGFVAAIDTGTNTVAKNIAVELPLDVAVDTSTHAVYVTGSYWGRNRGLSVIDATAGVVVAGINVEGSPVAVDPGTHRAYVADGGDHVRAAVSIVDLTANTLAATVEGDTEGPSLIAVDPATHTAYFAVYGGTVSVIDTTDTVVATAKVGSMPVNVAVDSGAHTVYVSDSVGAVSVIDTTTNTVTATIDVSGVVAAVDSAAHSAYIINGEHGTVAVLDTTSKTVTTTVKVGERPHAVVVDPLTHIAYVANSGDGTVSVISPSLT